MVLSSLGHVLREQRDASRTPLAPTHEQQQRGYRHSPTHHQSAHHITSHAYAHNTLLRPDGPTARQTVSASSSSVSEPTTSRRACVNILRGRDGKNARTHRKRDYRSAQHNTPHRALAQLALLLLRFHYHYRVRLRARGYIRPVCVALRFILELGVVM